MSKIVRAIFSQSAKNLDFGLIWRQKCLKHVKMHFPGLGVNTKVVDIDKIYLNMQNEQNR